MACPYFFPVARFESTPWAVPPRLPLGDAYTGECRANGTTFQPDETTVRDICNVGYGDARCDCFPKDAPADAVRFNIASDKGELIRIQYIFEKDCWPKEYGSLEWSATLQFTGLAAGEILQRQVTAFVESYLRRRNQ